ncbi:MAG: primosomal protein N' [Oscillospiraceae bacterium]
MEIVRIAKIAVAAAPYAIDKPYDYLIPGELQDAVLPGVRVTVPFARGNRSSEAVVLALGTAEKTPKLKAITGVLDAAPMLSQREIDMALWLRSRYFCTMYEAIKTILPAGIWYQFREIYRLTPGATRERAYAAAAQEELSVLDYLFAHGGEAEPAALKTACGEAGLSALKALCQKELVCLETTALRKISDKTKRMVELAVSAEEALAIVEPKRKSAPLRYEAVRLLCTEGKAAAADLCYFTGASLRTLRGLEKAGIVTFSEEELLRIPSPQAITPGAAIVLNDEQQAAYDRILALSDTGKAQAVLLQGVTGSGKTQVYIRLVQAMLTRGKTAIVLVPEIVLTPQMMEKFSSYFGEKVAMLHSGLRMSERYDQWKRIRRGEVSVVLGTRSAIFAPLSQLGLIVLDEEQEGSYQSGTPPRYHTRDVAKYRCGQEGATLLLGSATPAIESAYAAKNGSYTHLFLRRRYNERALPEVKIADLRQELRAGNAGAIGALLQHELEENLLRGEQSILFLNRRGNSRMLLCGECGQVPTCPRCSVAMTYHSANERLMCHYCGHSEKAYETCPDCGGRMKRVGVGTQKVEEELHLLFPKTPILRMDADTVSGGHEKLLARFEKENIPILLGTQMVTKGLDFQGVTLVGVLAADLSLYVDNYRAAERTFSLLTQVVGRAGRGSKHGRAVIQTYTPENDVIAYAARQDYDGFYDSEIRLRQLRRTPPFADLFTFTISGTDEAAVLRGGLWLRDALRDAANRPELAAGQPEVLGPAPAPIVKVDNRYRYRCLLVGKNDKCTRDWVAYLLKTFRRENRSMHLFVDCNALD